MIVHITHFVKMLLSSNNSCVGDLLNFIPLHFANTIIYESWYENRAYHWSGTDATVLHTYDINNLQFICLVSGPYVCKQKPDILSVSSAVVVIGLVFMPRFSFFLGQHAILGTKKIPFLPRFCSPVLCLEF